MTRDDDIRVELDDNVLERLASLVCGDDSTPYYRSSYQLTKFFDAAGWRRVGEVEPPRRGWVLARLKERRRDSNSLRRLILRLADPREYLDEDDVRIQVLRELNDILALEGYQVIYTGGRPYLITQTPTLKRPTMQTPLELTASLTDIVSDNAFGQQLRARLDEAHTCWISGAHTAAIIMLGSLLEGVLYDVALRQHTEGPKPDDRLENLINLAKDKGWFAQDVVDYAHVLRNHRNLVHPKKQLTQGYAPAGDTVCIAWNVVVAAMNDLAQLGVSTRNSMHTRDSSKLLGLPLE
jgi:hypothetical protein